MIVSDIGASHFQNSETAESIRSAGTFASKELETLYRQKQMPDDLSTAQIVLLVTCLGVLLFIPSDYRLFGTAAPFSLILAVRLGICLLSVFVLLKLRSATRVLCPQNFDRAFLVWGTLVSFSQIYVSSTRPANYTGHFLIHLFTVLLTYGVVPLPLRLQMIPTMIVSIGMVVTIFGKPPADGGLTTTAFFWTLVSTHVLGYFMSRQLQISKRKQFLAFRHESQLRMGLERTLAELKTLRGIIPICAHCKDIRNDRGSWQQLEEYISTHSDAEFSHGICPSCVETFFPAEELK